RRRWQLDHRADGHVVDRVALAPELVGAVGEDGLRPQQLVEGADAREEHANRPVRARAEQRSELRPEQIGDPEREADPRQAERRIRARGGWAEADELVAAEVEGAEDDRPAAELVEDLRVDGRLFLFGRRAAAVEVEELRPEEPDAG